MKYYLAGILFSMLVIGVSVSGYLIGNSSIINKLNLLSEYNFQDTIDSEDTSELKITNYEIDEKRSIIVKAVLNKKYTNLGNIIKTSVNFIIESTECCGMLSPVEVIEQIKYLNSSNGSWDFDENNPEIVNLKASFPEKYSNAIIGISSDYYLAAFQLDELGNISRISLAKDYRMILP